MVLGWMVVVALERESTVGQLYGKGAKPRGRGRHQLHLGESQSHNEWVCICRLSWEICPRAVACITREFRFKIQREWAFHNSFLNLRRPLGNFIQLFLLLVPIHFKQALVFQNHSGNRGGISEIVSQTVEPSSYLRDTLLLRKTKSFIPIELNILLILIKYQLQLSHST